MSATPEFSLVVTLADAAHGRAIAVEADADARARIAARLGLAALDHFVLTADVRAIAGGIAAKGEVQADLVQNCAATDLPVPATIREPFDLRFLRDVDAPASEDEEIEIGSDDLEALTHSVRRLRDLVEEVSRERLAQLRRTADDGDG